LVPVACRIRARGLIMAHSHRRCLG
jgi:hypothetical protein